MFWKFCHYSPLVDIIPALVTMQGLFAQHLEKNNNYNMGKIAPFIILFLLFSCGKGEDSDQDFSREERSWIRNYKSVKLGFASDYDPLLILKENGEIDGLYPELYREIERVTGLKFDIVIDKPEVLIGMLGENELDGVLVISDILLNELGLRPVRSLHQVFPIIYTRVDNRTQVNSLEDLKGSKIAYQQDSQIVEYSLSKLKDTYTAIPKNSPREVILSVVRGDVDYGILLNIQDYGIIRDSIQGIRIAFFDIEQINPLFTGIRSDLPELVHIINRSLDLIGRKEINKILQKWIQPAIVNRHVLFSSEENFWLDNNPSITVASDPSWSPVEFYSQRGEFEGIAIDLMDEVSSITGLKFNYITGKNWNELINFTKRGEVDIFSCISKTDDREEFLNFTDPYLDIPISIFTRKEINYISGLSALEDKRVGVVKGFAIEEWLLKGNVNLDLVSVDNTIDGLNRLKDGEILAFIGNRITTNWYIRQYKYKDLNESGITSYSNKLSIGVREDSVELLSILEKSLRVISNNRIDEITDNWLDKVEVSPSISPETLVIISLILALLTVLIGGIIYIRSLKRLLALNSANTTTSSDRDVSLPTQPIKNRGVSTPEVYESDKIEYLKGIEVWHSRSSYLNGLKQFALEHYNIGKDIEELIVEGKLQEAKDTTNTLKLMSGNLALTKVNSLANKIELLIKSNNTSRIEEMISDLKGEIKEAILVIREWCGGEV